MASLTASASGRLRAARVDDDGGGGFPRRKDFPVVNTEVCLNNARWHPLSYGATAAIQSYLEYKQRGVWNPPDQVSAASIRVKEAFARLIHAKPSEISYVNSTTAGENLIAQSLSLGQAGGGNVVTDGLHFEGSLYLYTALEKQGLDLRIVKPRNWKIEMADLEQAIDKKTKLVAVSQVSFVNGFAHDLKAVCGVAHAHGAHVYADVVQAAGAVPVDVRATGVDFCAAASYKWLMGDMGLGFLYVREDLLERIIQRPVFGYRQLASFSYHEFPGDPPGSAMVGWEQRPDSAGHFEIGTISNTTMSALDFSLAYIERLGVDAIHAHRQSLLSRVEKELPRKGFELVTPRGLPSPIVTFLAPDPARTQARLKAANVDVAWSGNRMRISPSVYNDQSDIDALLEAVS